MKHLTARSLILAIVLPLGVLWAVDSMKRSAALKQAVLAQERENFETRMKIRRHEMEFLKKIADKQEGTGDPMPDFSKLDLPHRESRGR